MIAFVQTLLIYGLISNYNSSKNVSKTVLKKYSNNFLLSPYVSLLSAKCQKHKCRNTSKKDIEEWQLLQHEKKTNPVFSALTSSSWVSHWSNNLSKFSSIITAVGMMMPSCCTGSFSSSSVFYTKATSLQAYYFPLSDEIYIIITQYLGH